MKRGSLDMLTVIDPAKVELQGVAWVKANTRKRCKVQNIMYSQKKWRRFCKYFVLIWIENFPPAIWNVYGMDGKIINRTNNPLERYHRELNARFLTPYPAVSTFVKKIEELARSYADLRKSILAKVANAPRRQVVKLPRAPTLPALKDIVASDTDEEDNVVNEHDVTGGTAIDEAEGKSDEELNVSDDVSSAGEEGGPPQYDTSFQYEAAAQL
ncbi:unnamed protein product [Phytophthora fragariaefolia]|uniref:Unnamed protein product n=1 Tax=Phytophthora fragariaefolia TaxID=1490495 RepID=A0A9W6Y710_9STRA|nr:unnamed protein product [Phytophthora fragariaefolia]